MVILKSLRLKEGKLVGIGEDRKIIPLALTPRAGFRNLTSEDGGTLNKQVEHVKQEMREVGNLYYLASSVVCAPCQGMLTYVFYCKR